MDKTILVIDDDVRLNRLLTDYLSGFGYRVETAVDPDEGLRKQEKIQPDLIILDVMMPGKDGFEVCRMIRKHSGVPIIMLTARGDLMDRVVGLELGADDYLPKPFEPRELVARIQSVLRRTAPDQSAGRLVHGSLEIDLDSRSVALHGDPVPMTTNEFSALSLLARNPGKVLDRDRILQELRGIDWEAFNRSVDITISRIRQKLGDDSRSPKFIKTIWGTGYMFVGANEDE